MSSVAGPLMVRERPPLRLNSLVETPSGDVQRWATDEHRAENAISNLSFSTVMPGGCETLTGTLQRDPSRAFPDLEQLARVTVRGAGARVAWQGRIQDIPDTSGDQAQITPQTVGYQAHLDDDNSAREIYVDCSFANWQGPSIAREIEWLTFPNPSVASGPSGGPDFSSGVPALITQLGGPWAQSQVCEGWYDARGIPIGRILAAWKDDGQNTIDWSPAAQFGAGVFLCTDDTGFSYDKFGNINYAPGTCALSATQTRKWALVQFYNDLQPGGQEGITYSLYWTNLAVYGTHNLPRQGAFTATSAPGLLASDIISNAVSRWAPQLYVSTGTGGTVQPSSFVIPQLVFTDPSKTSDIVKQASRFELLDWAVWPMYLSGTVVPAFYSNPRGGRGNLWRVRSGPAKLQETGKQASRLWNGVIVQWNDVTGVTRTVGPPGAGTNFTDTSLIDTDPQNPANEEGIKRWTVLQMGTSTQAGATKVGQVFLYEQKFLDTSGQATITGHVEDEAGNWAPAWAIRAGDKISFTDAHDPSYRRIVHTSYDDSSKSIALQLDQPPDALAALLERLSVILTPTGFS